MFVSKPLTLREPTKPTVIVAPALLLLLPFALLSTDDVACVAVEVDGAARVHVSWPAILCKDIEALEVGE